MGVGSEVYQAVLMGRRGVGMELKPTYYRQAQANIRKALETQREWQEPLFSLASKIG